MPCQFFPLPKLRAEDEEDEEDITEKQGLLCPPAGVRYNSAGVIEH